jgi:hypothetical protein
MAGVSVPDVAGWWLAFLILTIAGERLELSRILPPKPGSKALFLIATALLAVGASAGMMNAAGAASFGAGLLVLSTWLLRHDIALRNIRLGGQTRFFAACMLPGYGWLAVGGALLIALHGEAAHRYDMVLHAVALGFVLSMVFGHALIILPAVTGVRLCYSAALYLPLGVLHLAVLLRIAGGLADSAALRPSSGPLTVAALLIFVCCVALARCRSA